jgi:hypothetical protein
MPPTVQGAFRGTAAAFQSSLSNEALLILAALVTVCIVLGVLYESFISLSHYSLDAALSRRAAKTVGNSKTLDEKREEASPN